MLIHDLSCIIGAIVVSAYILHLLYRYTLRYNKQIREQVKELIENPSKR